MKDLFFLFVRMSVEASILIGVILLLRAVCKKVPRAFFYCLWLVALLRLLCPVHIETEARVVPGLSAVATGEIVNGDWQTDGVPPVTAAPDGQAITQEVAGSVPMSNVPGLLIADILAGLWIVGASVSLLVYAGQYVSLKKRLKTAVLAGDGVWESDTVHSPLVMGLIRPRIYVPMGLDGEDRDHILTHERMHIRHFDAQVRVLGLIALCLHWWNPVVWLAIRFMNQDMEMVCDESVLRSADTRTRKAYMRTLLAFSMKRSGLSVTPYFGETNTEKRIKHIMAFKKPTWIISIVLFIVITACVVVFFVVSKPDKVDNPDAPVVADEISPTPEQVQATDTPNMATSDDIGLVSLLEGYPEDVLPLYKSIGLDNCSYDLTNNDDLDFGIGKVFYSVEYRSEAALDEIAGYYQSLFTSMDESSDRHSLEGDIGDHRARVLLSDYDQGGYVAVSLAVTPTGDASMDQNPFFSNLPEDLVAMEGLVRLEWMNYICSSYNGDSPIGYLTIYETDLTEDQFIESYKTTYEAMEGFTESRDEYVIIYQWQDQGYSCYVAYTLSDTPFVTIKIRPIQE